MPPLSLTRVPERNYDSDFDKFLRLQVGKYGLTFHLKLVFFKMSCFHPQLLGSDTRKRLPQEEMPTDCCSLWSPPGGTLRATVITEPWVVPTSRHGLTRVSVFLGKLSQKWKEEMASRVSLSMLVTLELRERVNELSLASEQRYVDKWEIKKNFERIGMLRIFVSNSRC